MAKKLKRCVEDQALSSSYDASSTDDEDMSPDENKRRRRRSEVRRKTIKKQGQVIIQMLSEIKKEIHKQSKQMDKLTKSHDDHTRKLEKLTESHNDLCKQLMLHTNCTSGDDSHAPRSQPSQMKSPSYRLVFRSQMADKIEKGQSIEISVALVDSTSYQTVENGPLASATVELVVVNAEFNQHDNQYNWSREDFESNVKKARQGNPTMGDVDQPVKSIVSNGRFNLVHGAKLHSGSTIFSNSSNKKVRLGVMVVSPTEERVLEGLSNPFYVRGHDRPARQSNLRHNRSNRQRRCQEENGEMPNVENTSCPNSTQTDGIREDIIGGQSSQAPYLGKTTMLSIERPTSQEQQARTLQYPVPHLPMLVQTMNGQTDELSSALDGYVRNPNFVDNGHVPGHSNDPDLWLETGALHQQQHMGTGARCIMGVGGGLPTTGRAAVHSSPAASQPAETEPSSPPVTSDQETDLDPPQADQGLFLVDSEVFEADPHWLI